jgi:hypothetical protein
MDDLKERHFAFDEIGGIKLKNIKQEIFELLA